MADITVSIPDDVWPRVAAAFHGTWPDTQMSDEDIVTMSLKVYVRDTWVSAEQAANQNAAVGRYNQAAQDYNTARQAVDADIAAENEQVLADSQAAFPGI
ncbi:hypothetical protein EV284_3423 [Streptomyces sp. BK022]|uniref:hypothetical protein n=1 Tax=Streptomyces sp. BK022 TaxID=2512123 RepID=UPI001029E4F1|nr:hypothetical protein [Streptomyces sp. BK022]RZU35940.1 hypothetical protein EV284_3423 [Streptomyces sp. BK022]